MRFDGIWATASGSAAFRVIPKCACSTVGQLLHFSDFGHFFDGDIHSHEAGILKWENRDERIQIARIILSPEATTFTCVRNPYSRVLSAFFDKVAGTQANGTQYRAGAIHSKLGAYGVDLKEGFDQIQSFRNFLRFATETVTTGFPMEPDLHWEPMDRILGGLVKNGGRYDAVISTENLAEAVPELFSRIAPDRPIKADEVPRYNEGGISAPNRAFPLEDFFDETSVALMQKAYGNDFRLFNYPTMPGPDGPGETIDAKQLNRFLSR